MVHTRTIVHTTKITYRLWAPQKGWYHFQGGNYDYWNPRSPKGIVYILKQRLTSDRFQYSQ